MCYTFLLLGTYLPNEREYVNMMFFIFRVKIVNFQERHEVLFKRTHVAGMRRRHRLARTRCRNLLK